MPSEDTVEEVKRMSLTADGKSAVFDVPSKLAQVAFSYCIHIHIYIQNHIHIHICLPFIHPFVHLFLFPLFVCSLNMCLPLGVSYVQS